MSDHKDKTKSEISEYEKHKEKGKDSKKDREKHDSKKSKKHRHRSDSSNSPSYSRSRSDSEAKKKHKKKKSRSRSRSHRKKKSNSRSRKYKNRSRSGSGRRDRGRRRSRTPPKKRKDDWRFDSPPQEFQAPDQSVDLSEFGIPNLDVLKEMYPALKSMDPTELIRILNDMKNLRSAKVDRKLYVGNIPAGITPQQLMDLLNNALQKMGINLDPPGNSIIAAWISPDNHYAFIDFRNGEEATKGFALNSVAIHGQPLKVGRPRSYQQSQPFANPLTALLGSVGLPVTQIAGAGVETNAVTTVKVHPPSRILVLKNMVNISELGIDEEYDEIVEDVKEECSKFGTVKSIKIPRPIFGQTHIPGLGKIFIEYSSIDEAKEARKILQGRTFAEHTVECAYYDEELYDKDDFTQCS